MIAFALAYTAYSASAEDLTGWCFPATDCMGAQSKIENNSFGTCEEFCTLKNPFRIKGMKARFYDELCQGDGSPDPMKQKIIIAPANGIDGLELYYLSDSQIVKLERCR